MRFYLFFCLVLAFFCGSCSKPTVSDFDRPQAPALNLAFTTVKSRFVVPGELSFRYDQRRWYVTTDVRRLNYVPLPVAVAYARQGGGVVRFSLLPAGPNVTPKSITEQLTKRFRGTQTDHSSICHQANGVWTRCRVAFHTWPVKEKGLVVIRYLTKQHRRILVVIGQWPEGRDKALIRQCQKMADSVRPAAPTQ